MKNTFCQKFLNSKKVYYDLDLFICSLGKASIDNLPPSFAYFNLWSQIHL